MKSVKRVLKMFLLVLALPISLVVVFVAYLQGCKEKEGTICDPVHRRDDTPATGPAAGTQPTKAGPQTKATQPVRERQPMICDPVHIPPPPKNQK